MKNKQLVIELHEGCMNPNSLILDLVRKAPQESEQNDIVIAWIINKLTNDPDSIFIDKVEIIDCDCDVGD